MSSEEQLSLDNKMIQEEEEKQQQDSTNNNNDDDGQSTTEQQCCPICLCEEDDEDGNNKMTYGPCGHCLCIPCMERILLSHHNKTTNDNPIITTGRRREYYNDPDAHITAPTVGRCPICRSELSLFDLVVGVPTKKTCKVVQQKKHSNNKKEKETQKKQKTTTMASNVLVEKDYAIHQSEIAGLVFARDGQLGYASYHFPPPSSSSENKKSTSLWKTDSHGRPLPYVSYEHVGMDMNLDDGSKPPTKQYFEEGCHFHAKSRTFHGTLRWTTFAGQGGTGTDTKSCLPTAIAKEESNSSSATSAGCSSSETTSTTTWHGSKIWKVILQFSSDLRYVSNGILVKRREIPSDVEHPWPLDGRWKVTFDTQKDTQNNNTTHNDEETQYIEVIGGEYRLGTFRYTLDMSCPTSPKVKWPMTNFSDDSATLQTAVSGVNLLTHPKGPDVGDTIVWTTTDPEYSKILWVRQSIGGHLAAYRVERFGPRDLLYKQILGNNNDDESTRRTMPKYHAEALWGNTFIQALKVGLASYHFISPPQANENGDSSTSSSSPPNAYISYEHPRCGEWPPLDDGSPVPSRVPFRHIQWDETNHIFHGCILWEEEYGTTWQGAKKWIYEIRFDSEMICILSGKVQTVIQDNNTNSAGSDSNTDTIQDISSYGDSLIYINAAITERFTEMMDNSSHSSSPPRSQQHHERIDESISNNDRRDREEQQQEQEEQPVSPQRYSRFRNVVHDLRRRLEGENVSVRTMAMIHNVLVFSQRPDVEPIDFNLS